jgi:hypothetical protein
MVIYTSPHLHQTAMWMAGLEIISITLRQVSMGTSATQCISPPTTPTSVVGTIMITGTTSSYQWIHPNGCP